MHSLTAANDQVLRQYVKAIFALELGVSIEIEGSLYVRELDDGSYAVGGLTDRCSNKGWDWEKLFSDLEQALDCFIEQRNSMKWGADFWPSNIED